MLRTLALLLASLALGPVACDDGSPGDDTDTATTDDAATTDDEATSEQATTGEAIEPTPIPFQPPIHKECHYKSGARIGNCDA